MAWFLEDEDVSVDFVEETGFWVTLVPYAPAKAEITLICVYCGMI